MTQILFSLVVGSAGIAIGVLATYCVGWFGNRIIQPKPPIPPLAMGAALLFVVPYLLFMTWALGSLILTGSF